MVHMIFWVRDEGYTIVNKSSRWSKSFGLHQSSTTRAAHFCRSKQDVTQQISPSEVRMACAVLAELVYTACVPVRIRVHTGVIHMC